MPGVALVSTKSTCKRMTNEGLFLFEQMARKEGGKKGAKDMDNLKQELEIDDHKIPIEELYQRLGTNPETVSHHSFHLQK